MTITLEPELDTHDEAASPSDGADETMPSQTFSRVPLTTQIVTVLVALAVVATSIIALHSQARSRSEQAHRLDRAAAVMQQVTEDLEETAGTREGELDGLITRIDSARAELARKEALQ